MRIANPGAVYRSVNPEHLRIASENEAERAVAIALMCNYARALVTGVDSDSPDAPTAFGAGFDDGGFWFTGITAPRGTEPPNGMRVNTKARAKHGAVLVPRKSTEEGKVIASQMRALSFTPQSLGSVSHIVSITDGTNSWFSQGVIEVIAGEVFAEYHHPISERDRQRVESDPDWVPCPLSEFYAAREAVTA